MTLIKVTEVLTPIVVASYTSNINWSDDVRNYLTSISNSIIVHINLQYGDLMALNTFEPLLSQQNSIAQYLFDLTHNEFEKIFKALTVNYDPKHNYHRTISEKNTGSNTNKYSGTDTEKVGGKDTTNVKDGLTVSSKANDINTIKENTYDEANVQGFRPTMQSNSDYSSSETYNGTTDTTVDYGKSVDTTYGRNLEMQFGRNVDTEIDGTNGIFPYPDLIRKEYDLRIIKQLFDTVIHILINAVSCGVWSSVDETGD